MFDSLAETEDRKNHPDDSYHVGTVVANDDRPAFQQRIKVTIPGYLTDTNPSNLPWVGPKAQSKFGNTDAFGTVSIPVIGSRVIVTFQGGDMNHGLYEGFVTTSAMGHAMPAQLKTNYPNRYGYWDPKGNIAFTDLTTGEMQLIHSSGTTLDIATDGTVTGTFVKDLNASIAGTATTSAAQWNHTGPVKITGKLHVTDTITEDVSIVTPSAVINGIEHATHQHETYGTFSPTSGPIA
jgi:phage gp45-like